MHSKKRLGQYFLLNKEKIEKIVDSLELKKGDLVIEIGAGKGELTREIVHKFTSLRADKFKIIAIEKDQRLVDKLLSSEVSKLKNVEVVGGDALKILPGLTYKLKNLQTYKLVGNIPYYITGRLLRVIGELEPKASLVVLTLQKEVAERVCAKPRKMNLLAASVQFWAVPEIVDYVPKEDFSPQPKVDSAVLKLTTKPSTLNSQPYYHLIKILFKQPRKTILNNLLRGYPKKRTELIKKLEEVHINSSDRPQTLSVSKIQKLSQRLADRPV